MLKFINKLLLSAVAVSIIASPLAIADPIKSDRGLLGRPYYPLQEFSEGNEDSLLSFMGLHWADLDKPTSDTSSTGSYHPSSSSHSSSSVALVNSYGSKVPYSTVVAVRSILQNVASMARSGNYYYHSPALTSALSGLYHYNLDYSGVTQDLVNMYVRRYQHVTSSGTMRYLDLYFTKPSVAHLFGYKVGVDENIVSLSTGRKLTNYEAQQLQSVLHPLYNALYDRSVPGVRNLLGQLHQLTGIDISDPTTTVQKFIDFYDIYYVYNTDPHLLATYGLHMSGYYMKNASGTTIPRATMQRIDKTLGKLKILRVPMLNSYTTMIKSKEQLQAFLKTQALANQLAYLNALKSKYATSTKIAELDTVITKLTALQTKLKTYLSTLHIDSIPRKRAISTGDIRITTAIGETNALINNIESLIRNIDGNVASFKTQVSNYNSEVKKITDLTHTPTPTPISASEFLNSHPNLKAPSKPTDFLTGANLLNARLDLNLDLNYITGQASMEINRNDPTKKKRVNLSSHGMQVINKLYDLKTKVNQNYDNAKNQLQTKYNNLNTLKGNLQTAINNLKSGLSGAGTPAQQSTIRNAENLIKQINQKLATANTLINTAKPTMRSVPVLRAGGSVTIVNNLIKTAQATINDLNNHLITFTNAQRQLMLILAQFNDLDHFADPNANIMPKTGAILAQTLRDLNFTNDYITRRRLQKTTGLWTMGSMPITESDYNLDLNQYLGSKNYSFAIGFDNKTDKNNLIGAYFQTNMNKSEMGNKNFKQDKFFINFGVNYAYYVEEYMYLSANVSLGNITFDNKIRRGLLNSTSSIDTMVMSETFAVGGRPTLNTGLEAFFRHAYIFDNSFHENEQGLSAGISNGYAKIDGYVYLAIGGRAFFDYEHKVSKDLLLKPFAQGFIELSTGDNLSGSFSNGLTLNSQRNGSFEKGNSIHYGLTLGNQFIFDKKSGISANISYNLNHFSNTAHSLNLGLNIDL